MIDSKVIEEANEFFGEIYKNFTDTICLYFQEDPDYMVKNLLFELSVDDNGEGSICVDNLFENVSPQLLCIKIVHSIAMMNSFFVNYKTELGVNKFYKLYGRFLNITLSVNPSNVEIINRSGFGIIGYNQYDMGYCISQFFSAFNNFLKNKSKEKEYKFLKIILNNYDDYASSENPDSALMTLFIYNEDFFKPDEDNEKNISYFCDNCNVEVELMDKSCPNCGFKFDKIEYYCDNCGSVVAEKDKKCKNCGYRFID